LVPIATEIFDQRMPAPNQIDQALSDFHATAADLLQAPSGNITEAGLRQNIAVGLGYLEAWLRGIGCVPLFNLMEDAATAEISRAQIWQWIFHGCKTKDGRTIDVALCEQMIGEELAKAKQAADPIRATAYENAAQLMRDLIRRPQFVDFLTIPAYQLVLNEGS